MYKPVWQPNVHSLCLTWIFQVYRLQGSVRASDFAKKDLIKDDKRIQRELMDTMRSSNDVIAQMTSRLRKAEEKLHQERENVKNLMILSKKLEQVIKAVKQLDLRNQAGLHYEMDPTSFRDLKIKKH